MRMFCHNNSQIAADKIRVIHLFDRCWAILALRVKLIFKMVMGFRCLLRGPRKWWRKLKPFICRFARLVERFQNLLLLLTIVEYL